MANDKFLEELANKLNNHSSEVNPQMWSSIQSQIGTASTVGAGSVSGAIGFGKIAAIVVGVTSIAVASYFAVNTNKEEKTTNQTNQIDNQETKRETPAAPNEINLTAENKEVTEDKIIKDVAPAKTNKVSAPSTSVKQTEQIELITPLAPELILSIAEKNTKTTNPTEKKDTPVKVEKKETPPVIDKAIEQTKKPLAYSIQKMPNIFTPNGDGVNDYFQIESEGLENYSLVVLDLSNKVVWQTKDSNAKWDGTDMEGNKVPKGQYVYFLAAQDANGNAVGKHERLTVQF